ncbi:MAG: hypothetical protein ACR5LF_12880 [Symbiopectobacterium sp.]
MPAIKGILEQLAQRLNPVQVQAFIKSRAGAGVYQSARGYKRVCLCRGALQGASYGERLLHSVRAHVRLPDIRSEAETTELHQVA